MSAPETIHRPTPTGPGLVEWWTTLFRGMTLLKDKEYRQALDEFERVIALDRESVYASIAHHLCGQAHLEMQELRAAQQDFQRASALWPAHILSGVLAEWLEMALRVDRKRAERLRRAERLETLAVLAANDRQQRASLFLCLGMASWLRKAFGRAQYYLDQSLVVEHDWPAWFWMGLVLAARNDPKHAKTAFDRARSLSMPAALSCTLNWLPSRQRELFYFPTAAPADK